MLTVTNVSKCYIRGEADVQALDDVSVHVDAGENYELQFKESLHQGVEFRVIKSRAGWHQVELPDGKTGWIPRAAAELL